MPRVVRLTRKGQVTIPKEVRDALRLRPFDKIEFAVEDGEATLRKARRTLADIAGRLPKLGIAIEDMPAVAKDERIQRLVAERRVEP